MSITFEEYPTGNPEVLAVYKDGLYLQAIKKEDRSKAFTLLDKNFTVLANNKSWIVDIDKANDLYADCVARTAEGLKSLYPNKKLVTEQYWCYHEGRATVRTIHTPYEGNCFTVGTRIILEIKGELVRFRPCTKCNGTRIYQGLLEPRPCSYCETGWFLYPEHRHLIAHCIATQGKNKGKVRASAPTTGGAREKYFWRMYRFYTGADCTLPVMASLDIEGDPYADLIDNWACECATINKNLSGLEAWKRALFGD